MTLFKDRYRAESARLKGWDYSAAGYYFVTICTRDRECRLGDVIDGVMRLSPVGEIVAEEWQKTTQIRKNVTLDEWVVMPNHLHGIVIIHENETPHRGVSTEEPDNCRDAPVGRLPVLSGRLYKGSLGAIIGQFKSVCTKRIWATDRDFAWQPRFHDEIIRDENMLEKVRDYIRNNTLQWELDNENPANYPLIQKGSQYRKQMETTMSQNQKIDSIEILRDRLREFAKERDWDQFHTPKNLSMALIAEAAELVEHFQWVDGAKSHLLEEKLRPLVEEELADIFIYLVRIADKLDIDLYSATERKIGINEHKYPADKVRGSARKYTEYED